MGQILLSGLEFYAYHGYFDEERKQGNKFEVDVTIETDLSLPAKNDNLSDTIDYGKVYAIVKEEMQIPSRLLEHVAQRIIDALKNQFPDAETFTVSVKKYNPPLDGICKYSKVTLSQ